VIQQAFKPGEGWKGYPFRKRASVSWLRKMKSEGYTAVGLLVPVATTWSDPSVIHVISDFQIKELV
jgi:hypothetical protein